MDSEIESLSATKKVVLACRASSFEGENAEIPELRRVMVAGDDLAITNIQVQQALRESFRRGKIGLEWIWG